MIKRKEKAWHGMAIQKDMLRPEERAAKLRAKKQIQEISQMTEIRPDELDKKAAQQAGAAENKNPPAKNGGIF